MNTHKHNFTSVLSVQNGDQSYFTLYSNNQCAFPVQFCIFCGVWHSFVLYKSKQNQAVQQPLAVLFLYFFSALFFFNSVILSSFLTVWRRPCFSIKTTSVRKPRQAQQQEEEISDFRHPDFMGFFFIGLENKSTPLEVRRCVVDMWMWIINWDLKVLVIVCVCFWLLFQAGRWH